MKYLSLCFFITLLTYAQNITTNHEKRLRNLKDFSMRDLEHENPGCPENSICSKQMGVTISKFEKYIQINGSSPSVLEKYRSSHGIPVEFKIKKDKIKIFDVLAYKSQCTEDQNKDLLVGRYLYKRLPKSDDLIFNQYQLDNKNIYHLPLNASPFAFYKRKLLSVLTIEDYIFYLESDLKGNWKIVNTPRKVVTKASILNTSSRCEGKVCREIWNHDQNKLTKLTLINTCQNEKSRTRKTSILDSEIE